MSYWNQKILDRLVGREVRGIFMDETNLTFETDEEPVSYYVDGDCCSWSYFHDFYGVENLLGSTVRAFESVELSEGDPGWRKETWDDGAGMVDYEDIQVYGFRLTFEHPKFGDMSAVLSFRNSSNGYYGGDMNVTDSHLTDEANRLTADKIGE